MKYVSALTILIAFVIGTGCGGPTAEVTFTDMSQPSQPLSSEYMHIAVYQAETSGSAEYDQEKWREIAADTIQAVLEDAKNQHNIPIQLVDRQHVKIALAESDMKDAGITGGAPPSSALSEATAIITSKVNVKVDTQKGKKRSLNVGAIAGRVAGFGGGPASRELDEIKRTITVQCQFQLKANDGSNTIIVSHNGRPEQLEEEAKASAFSSSSKTEQDLTSRDKVIGAIVEKQIRDFTSKFIPTEYSASVEVESSSNEDCAMGVKSLVLGDWDSALMRFKKAVEANDKDDKALFGAGVASEKLGRLSDAKRFYKLARSYDMDQPHYAASVRRLEGKM
jgi:hypothetical protein